MVKFTWKLTKTHCFGRTAVVWSTSDWTEWRVLTELLQTPPNKRDVNTAYKQALTWNPSIVFSWQVASHIAHCTQRRYSKQEFKAVFPTDLRTVLQNTRGSEATW